MWSPLVGRRDPQVGQEPHDLATVDLQPPKQASGRCSSPAAPPARWAWRHRVGGAASCEDAVVAVGEARHDRWRQPVGGGVAGSGGLGAGDRKPLRQLRRPALPRQLGDPLQLAEQVRRAQRVGGLGVAPVRRPAIMHRHPVESWEDSGGVHRHHATLGMHAEQAQQRRGRRVDGSAAGPRPWRRSRRSGRPRPPPTARGPARRIRPARWRPGPPAHQACQPSSPHPAHHPAPGRPARPAGGGPPAGSPPAHGPQAHSTPPNAPARGTPQQ